MKRASMDRFIDTIEWIAAAFVGIVAANIFIAVLLRNIFNYAIPDSFDIGRMMLGILIFWGIAATSYRGGHITVDLVWANVGPRYQRWIDVFATLVLLFVVAVQTWTLFDKVQGTYNDNVLTFDMRMPTWPFFAIAWAGDASAVLLIAIRTYRLIFHPEEMEEAQDQGCGVDGMSTDAVAILGFVALFALMLLRVPVGMAMGLVGVTGFGYLVGFSPALKMVGQTSMRTVTDYTFGVIPMFLLMGAFVSNSGMSRELFRAANGFVGHLRGGLGIATVGGLRRLCRDLRLVGGDRRDIFRRRLSGNAPLRLSAILRHRRDRGRRHARRHAAAVDGAGGLRHHHRAGHRQAVHGRHHSRPARHGHVHADDHADRLVPAGLPADRTADHLARAVRRLEEYLGAGAAVRLRDRRPLRAAVPAALHPDRGRRRRRRRRVPDRRG